jgi:hypothetical protein
MTATALVLVALSIQVCGVDAWWDWLKVAQQTELYYQSLPRWTALSRDLPGLLRRIEQGVNIERAGWALVLAVMAITIWMYWRHARTQGQFRSGRALVAISAGAILACPRFMFYDLTLAVVPVLFGLADWSAMDRRARWIFGSLAAMLWVGTAYEYTRWSMLGPPLGTFALIGLWLWGVLTVLVPVCRTPLPFATCISPTFVRN